MASVASLMCRPPLLVGLEVVAVAVDPPGEVGRVLAGEVAGLLDVAVVEGLDEGRRGAARPRPGPALGVLDEELAGLLDQVGIVGVGQAGGPVRGRRRPGARGRRPGGSRPCPGARRAGRRPRPGGGSRGTRGGTRGPTLSGVGLVGGGGGLGLDGEPAGLLPGPAFGQPFDVPDLARARVGDLLLDRGELRAAASGSDGPGD